MLRIHTTMNGNALDYIKNKLRTEIMWFNMLKVSLLTSVSYF